MMRPKNEKKNYQTLGFIILFGLTDRKTQNGENAANLYI